jgi:branched-chain amino acid transport system ATP-binding protein
MTATVPATPRSPSPRGAPLFELRAVEASYGPYRALFGVSFAVAERSVLALLGSNGSGKTSVARVCSGLLRPTAGDVVFDSAVITGRSAYRTARMGIVHAPEGRSVFSTLSVEENLALTFRQVFGRRGTKPALEQAYELFPRLEERRRQLAGTLSGGEQRMLSLARVVVQSPKLLIADELSFGLAPVMIEEVYETLATIRDQGTALVVIEQHVRQALSFADDVVVLAKGRVVLRETVNDLPAVTGRVLEAVQGDPAADADG